MKKIPVVLAAGVMVFMLSSCGQAKDAGEVQTDIINNIPQNSKEADKTDAGEVKNTEHEGNDHSESVADERIVDYEALGIKEYEYPSEFSMGDNLKTAIVQLALRYESFDRDTPKTGGWKEDFIAAFIQNSRVSFDYLDLISNQNNGQISIDELNYIQYSLTNTELDFSAVANGSIDRYEAASSFSYGSISGYDYKETDSGVLVTADLEVRYDGTEDVQKYEITAELIRNPYSCFDGYSVAAFSSTMADNLEGDANPSAEEILEMESQTETTQILEIYEGEYAGNTINDPDYDGLEIQKNEDGTYEIQVKIPFLTKLYECTGYQSENIILFSTSEWGTDKKVEGSISLNDDSATVTFTSGWYQTATTESSYQYHKTSDTPHLENGPFARPDYSSFTGEYCDANDDPSLEIQLNEDGSYLIQISLFREIGYDACIGSLSGEKIYFTSDQSGGVSGSITLDNDLAVVRFEQIGYFENSKVTTYLFHKTSDNPNIDEQL